MGARLYSLAEDQALVVSPTVAAQLLNGWVLVKSTQFKFPVKLAEALLFSLNCLAKSKVLSVQLPVTLEDPSTLRVFSDLVVWVGSKLLADEVWVSSSKDVRPVELNFFRFFFVELSNGGMKTPPLDECLVVSGGLPSKRWHVSFLLTQDCLLGG